MKKAIASFLFLLIIKPSFSQTWSPPEFGNIQAYDFLGNEGAIFDFTEWNDTLYCAGFFINGIGDTIEGVAKYNGNYWEELFHTWDLGGNAGLNVFQNQLVITNSVEFSIDSLTFPGFAIFDGKNLSHKSIPYTSGINHVFFHDNWMWVAGTITDPDSNKASSILRYDGVKWDLLDSGLGTSTNAINSIFLFNNKVHAIGLISASGNRVIENHLAFWENEKWNDYQYQEWYNFIPCCPKGAIGYNDKIVINRGKERFYWFDPNADTVFYRENQTFFRTVVSRDLFFNKKNDLFFMDFQQGLLKYNNKTEYWDSIAPVMSSIPQKRVIYNFFEYNNKLWVTGGFSKNEGAEVNYIAWLDTAATDIIELNKNEQFSIFPNPSSEIIEINNSNGINHISVYNIQGQQVYSEPIIKESTQIKIESWKNGIYFIKAVTDENEIIIKKFVKI